MHEIRKWNCKILCMEKINDEIIAGDALGHLIILNPPNYIPRIIFKTESPISGFTKIADNLFVATWKGEIISIKSGRKIILGENMIKAFKSYKEHMFAGIDNLLYVIDNNMNIINKIECEDKIQAIYFNDRCGLIAMNCGILGQINNLNDDNKQIFSDCKVTRLYSATVHEKNILSVKIADNEVLTGCIEGILGCNNKIIYEEKRWIRSIFSKNLFTAGNSVIYNGKEIYSHKDDVMDVLETDKVIISCGLDEQFGVFYKNIDDLFL
ncbi:hypothetical protein NUSPORA_00327 [Nucleospora cyclopteri]